MVESWSVPYSRYQGYLLATQFGRPINPQPGVSVQMKIRKLTSRLFPLLIVVFSGAGMMAQAATIFQSSGSSYIAFEAESTASLTNAPPTTWVVTNEASASAGLALYQAGANGTTSSSSFAYYALKFSVAG